MPALQTWRKRNGLTQVDAASLLGISQTYLSLHENGARPLTAALRKRMKLVVRNDHSTDEALRGQLSSLGYPGFAHLTGTPMKASPDVLLLAVLSRANADARIGEALPWLVRHYANEMDFDRLTRQAKLRNLQNRMGFQARQNARNAEFRPKVLKTWLGHPVHPSRRRPKPSGPCYCPYR
jgi:transcriptional regulator with XRE-family HTH domain